MTAPGPVTPPAPAIRWPGVFDGIGALFVRCDNDPDVQAAKIPGLTWCAVKTNDVDASPLEERRAWMARMRARGVQDGTWGYCFGQPYVDVVGAYDPPSQPFVVYDVEAEYKTDGGAPADLPARLIAAHRASHGDGTAAAVTSYGAIPGFGTQPSSIDFGAFARAGWPILAQCYDSFADGDELTYATEHGGPYPVAGIHRLTRRLKLRPGESVYRPESIDG